MEYSELVGEGGLDFRGEMARGDFLDSSSNSVWFSSSDSTGSGRATFFRFWFFAVDLALFRSVGADLDRHLVALHFFERHICEDSL